MRLLLALSDRKDWPVTLPLVTSGLKDRTLRLLLTASDLKDWPVRLPVSSSENKDERAAYVRRLKAHFEDDPRYVTVLQSAVEKLIKTMMTLDQVKVELATPISKTSLKRN